jgi:hypothetical protein
LEELQMRYNDLQSQYNAILEEKQLEEEKQKVRTHHLCNAFVKKAITEIFFSGCIEKRAGAGHHS